MAKKKVIDLRAAGDAPAGDVNITYNGVRIAGFSEDTDATLKTGMKRVEHDIEIDYQKPVAPPMYNGSIRINNHTPNIIYVGYAAEDSAQPFNSPIQPNGILSVPAIKKTEAGITRQYTYVSINKGSNAAISISPMSDTDTVYYNVSTTQPFIYIAVIEALGTSPQFNINAENAGE